MGGEAIIFFNGGATGRIDGKKKGLKEKEGGLKRVKWANIMTLYCAYV